jgi:hypothetical protein
MTAAITDPDSVLHASCVTLRASGAQLLARAQAAGLARVDIDGADLFALVGALAWQGNDGAGGILPFEPKYISKIDRRQGGDVTTLSV